MNSKPPPSPLLLAGMGMTIAICVTGGMAAGFGLGNAIGGGPLLVFVGLAVGIATAVVTVRAEVKRYM